MSVATAAPVLAMRGIGKSFGATRALVDVDVDLRPGSILALIGENGAGKSTLVKVLSGVYAPDAGAMRLGGEAYRPQRPLDARRRGVAMVHQEPAVALELDVVENVTLGLEPRRWGWIDRRRQREMADEALARLGARLPRDRPVGDLPLAQRQLVEIARALVTRPRVLVLDEPTSSLGRSDTERLFAVLRRLRSEGVAIVYISHFLEECRRVADSYLVLRDGVGVGSGRMADGSDAELIRLMVGRAVDDLFPRSPHPRGDEILAVEGLTGRAGRPCDAGFRLHRGEVLGLFGLVGAGRSELVRCCFGLDPVAAGRIAVDGRPLRPGDPAARWRRGMGLVAENRQEEGLLLERDLADNLTLTRLGPYRVGGFVRGRRQRAGAAAWIERLGIRARGPAQAVGALSGGNQQKVAVGRLLHHGCEVLLLDEPTRGIDVGSKAQIYALIDRQAVAGKAVLVVSSYLPELFGICDRLLVMCRGRIVADHPVADWNEEGALAAAIGAAGKGEPDGRG